MPELTREEAARLNFQPPAPPAFAEVPEQTDIVAFSNPHTWPVRISNSAMGITVTIPAKSGPLRNHAGKVITDPRFMYFVGPGQLTVERGQSPSPVVAWDSATPASAASRTGFSGSSVPSKATQPRTPAFTPPAGVPRAMVPPPAVVHNGSVVGFTDMAAARKAGLLEAAGPEIREGVADTDGSPPSGIPTMTVPNYRSHAANVDPNALRAFAETVEQQRKIDSVLSANHIEVYDEPTPVIDVAKAMLAPSNTPAAVVPVPVPAVDPGFTLPAPELDDEHTPSAAGSVASEELPFTDPKTGKSFKYRSYLATFLRRQRRTPEEIDSVMSAYPETPRGRKRST